MQVRCLREILLHGQTGSRLAMSLHPSIHPSCLHRSLNYRLSTSYVPVPECRTLTDALQSSEFQHYLSVREKGFVFKRSQRAWTDNSIPRMNTLHSIIPVSTCAAPIRFLPSPNVCSPLAHAPHYAFTYIPKYFGRSKQAGKEAALPPDPPSTYNPQKEGSRGICNCGGISVHTVYCVVCIVIFCSISGGFLERFSACRSASPVQTYDATDEKRGGMRALYHDVPCNAHAHSMCLCLCP
ncbi:hypothetical protein B0J11DRAFT_134203 [Dendryphion nanum]|uniref:Uncharacterized protein n=1 Tax=Dendryphion nanum TaxID=256645 RepID=A0A9P9D8J6_9PLEO|nr:hypothetical protein B0J11DRAFT_134203 [Dendryphion nanum]